MNRATAKEIGQKIEAALKSIGEELGMQIRAVGGNYGATACQIKLEVSELSDGGVAKTPARDAFVQQAHLYGLSPDDLDQVFEANDGTTLTIEEWGDEDGGDWEYDLSLSRRIDPDDIGVLVEKAGSTH